MASMTQHYLVGIMKILVEEQELTSFHRLVDRAIAILQEYFVDEDGLMMELVEFSGPHLVPTRGTYNPIDFLELGLSEKLSASLTFY